MELTIVALGYPFPKLMKNNSKNWFKTFIYTPCPYFSHCI